MGHVAPTTTVRRIRDVRDEGRDGGCHVLVDRVWPRGLAKADAPHDEWVKDAAPSTELRKWYGHDPERFGEFARRYRAELDDEPAASALATLRSRRDDEGLVLLTATRDVEHSHARVLADVLDGRSAD
jgi:uncharacterized protein YeaO (DUF488 family)